MVTSSVPSYASKAPENQVRPSSHGTLVSPVAAPASDAFEVADASEVVGVHETLF